MKILHMILLAGATILLVLSGTQPAAQAKGDRSFKADLIGFEETPAISTAASGEFRAKFNHKDNSLDYRLSYENLQGTVTQAHIHFGQKSVAGGISIWLCQTTTNPSPVSSTPTCPGPNSGVVTGTVTAADVIGPSGQGIAAGEFEEVLDAMSDGVTYANVHSSTFPPGEIRGQIK